VNFCPVCGNPLEERPPLVCPSCGAEHWRNAKPCAGALVVRDGLLLLLRRANEPWLGRWDIPGGFCDAEEHPMETAVREAVEETGIEVEITGFLGMWLDRYPDPTEPDHPEVTLNAYYHAVTVDDAEGRPEPGEASELGWFAPDDLPAEIAFPNHAPAVLTAWREAITEGRTITHLPDRPDA
jgi:8-oxo-dGTP diphosphatase